MILSIYNEADLELFRQATKDQVVGITSGCFDLLHALHLLYLQRCQPHCDKLIVGVDSDDLIKKTKEPDRPIWPQHQRIAMVEALKCVDAAFILGKVEDFGLAVQNLGAKIIFKNNAFEGQHVQGQEFAEVMIIPDVQQFDSTSAIINAIRALDKK